MKRNLGVIAGALVVSTVSAQAQGSAGSPQCVSSLPAPAGPAQENACNTAIDLFNYMAPQLGATIAGGNTTLGQGGSLGGPGHFAITIRGNALKGSLPEIDKYDPTSSSRTLETKDQVLALPNVDAAIGVFGGLPIGITKVGGIDVLLNGSYIPEYSGNGVTVKAPNGTFKIGYGARIGLLQEGLLTPGIGFSYVKRDLPTVDVVATTTAGGGATKLAVTGLSVKTTSWRATASKSLLVLGLAVGVGQDSYDSKASMTGTITSPISTTASANGSQSITRTNYFADLSLNMMLAKLVAEVGMVQGGKIPTYNTFNGTAADASRLFASAGLRIGF